MKFCLIHHIHLNSCQLSSTSSNISTFLQGKCFHNQQEAKKNALQEFVESQNTDFYATGETNLFVTGKEC